MDIHHYYVWKETVTVHNGGNLNFLTGAGGVLQVMLKIYCFCKMCLFEYFGAVFLNKFAFFYVFFCVILCQCIDSQCVKM